MITTQEITDIVNQLCSTKEEFASFLQQGSVSTKIRSLDKAIEALNAEQAEAIKPVNDRRIALQNQKTALIAQLS